MNTTTLEATPENVAKYEETLNSLLADLDQMQKEIVDNRREIEQLRSETQIMLENTLALLKVA